MSYTINQDTFYLLVLSAHANLHDSNLPVHFITIAVIIFFGYHAKAVFYFFDDLYLEL